MFSLLLMVAEDGRDELVADLWEAGTTGITEEDGSLRAFFDNSATAEELVSKFARFRPEVMRHEDIDWVKSSQDQWQPFTVGETFFLAPQWRDDPTPQNRTRLTIYPGMASGSGTHPATQLCLRALERHIHGGRVLDVGTGSGILAEASRLTGASVVFACDIDDEATRIARANANDRSIRLFTGSVRSVKSGSVDVLVANLNAASIQAMAADLRRAVATGGLIILSGFRTEDQDRVASAIRLASYDRLEQGGWCCLIFSKQEMPGSANDRHGA